MAQPASPPPKSFSLFDSLTRPTSTKEHAATELILNLLKAVGYEACQTKRNGHYVFTLVSDIKRAYDEIHYWIDQINSDEPNIDVWGLFTAYTGAINPLEERLSQLFRSLQEVSNKEKTCADDNDLGPSSFDLVDSFEEIRKILRATANKLKVHFTQTGTISSANSRFFGDDYLYLQNLRSKLLDMEIGGHFRNDLLREIDISIKQLGIWSTDSHQDSQDLTAETVATKGVQVWMLVQSVVDKGNPETVPPSLKAFLDTDQPWEELLSATRVVNKHFTDLGLSFDELLNRYKALVAYLKSRTLSDLPKLLPVYLEVLKLVSKTSRPYFAQAVTLAKECQNLASVYASKELSDRHKIEKALDTVQKALESAERWRSQNTLQFQKSDEVGKAFDGAHDLAKKCLKALKLTENGTEWDQEMATAKASDDERKQDFETHVKPRMGQPAPKALITVKIEFRTSDLGGVLSKPLTTHSYQVEKTTTLSTLLWERIRSDANPVELNIRAHFIKSAGHAESDNPRLDSDLEVGKIQANAQAVDIILVIPEGEAEYDYDDEDWSDGEEGA